MKPHATLLKAWSLEDGALQAAVWAPGSVVAAVDYTYPSRNIFAGLDGILKVNWMFYYLPIDVIGSFKPGTLYRKATAELLKCAEVERTRYEIVCDATRAICIVPKDLSKCIIDYSTTTPLKDSIAVTYEGHTFYVVVGDVPVGTKYHPNVNIPEEQMYAASAKLQQYVDGGGKLEYILKRNAKEE